MGYYAGKRGSGIDQPAEGLVSAGFSVQFTNMGTLAGMPFPGVALVPGTFLSNPLAVGGPVATPVFQQHASSEASKQNQVWKFRLWLLHI